MPSVKEQLADAIQRVEHLAEHLMIETARMKQLYRQVDAETKQIGRDVFAVPDAVQQEET